MRNQGATGALLIPMKAVLLLAPAILASCAAVPAAGPDGSGDCPVSASSNWAAWVSAMPGPNARPKLIVTGKVTVPTGGFSFRWGDMRVMESHPVQVVAELRPVPPTGGATEALVTHDVRGEWPISPPVGSVTVRCADRTLATISPVETVY